MNQQEYIKKALRSESKDYKFQSTGDITPRIEHAVYGLVTEAGELLDAIKKAKIYGQKLDKVNVVEELGDIMWYRNFKNPEDVATAFGTSGHTGFLSNEFDPSAFKLLSCARSHEDGLDGYSISPFTFRLPNHDFGFLRPKKSFEDAITFPPELDVVGSSAYDTSGELFDGILEVV